MIYLETTSQLSISTLHRLLSHRIKGHVRLRQIESLYLFHCQSTQEYHQVLSFIQENGGFPLLVDGQVFVLKQYLPSKL